MPAVTSTQEQESLKAMLRAFYGYIIPSVAIFGIAGNVLALIVLNNKDVMRTHFTRENPAKVMMKALALSDLMFCLLVFPTAFLPHDGIYADRSVILYFRRYGWTLINIFILSSTWLTVALAIERYCSVAHSRLARRVTRSHILRLGIAAVFVASALFNLPILWRFETRPVVGREEPVVLESNHSFIFTTQVTDIRQEAVMVKEVKLVDNNVDYAYRLLWSLFGNIFPLLVLLYTSARLVQAITLAQRHHQRYNREDQTNMLTYSTSMSRSRSSAHEARHGGGGGGGNTSAAGQRASNLPVPRISRAAKRIIVILLLIVTTFLILVVPSELVRIFMLLTDENTSDQTYSYKVSEVVLNFMQTLNFSVNFVIYCAANESFRTVMLSYVLCLCCMDMPGIFEEESLFNPQHPQQQPQQGVVGRAR